MRRFQYSLRVVMITMVLLALLMSYVGSYYRLSRRGMVEAERELGVENSFLYVPVDEVMTTKDLGEHYQRRRFYSPVNWLDRVLFDGPGPCDGIMFELQ